MFHEDGLGVHICLPLFQGSNKKGSIDRDREENSPGFHRRVKDFNKFLEGGRGLR